MTAGRSAKCFTAAQFHESSPDGLGTPRARAAPTEPSKRRKGTLQAPNPLSSSQSFQNRAELCPWAETKILPSCQNGKFHCY